MLIENLASCVVLRDPVNYNSIINGLIILFFTKYIGGEGYCINFFVAQRPSKQAGFFGIIMCTYIYKITKNDYIYHLSQKCF